MARIDMMIKKACPFRGFAECLLENCMAWSGFDCRMFSVSPMFMGGGIGNNTVVNPAIAFQATQAANELFSQEQLQGTKEVVKKENQAEGTNNEEKQEKQNPKAKVTVTEIKVTKNGNTRVVCKVAGGKEDQIIVTKNGVGELLQKGLNKEFEIEYNVMKDGDAWWGIRAKQL